MTAEQPRDSSRTRSRNNLLHLIYDIRFPNLKVVKKCRSNLAVMGVPGSNGDHFLWPEEAVFLMESSLALVQTKNRPMTQYEGYRILEEKKVSFAKYITYGTLRRAGFVVLRPKTPQVITIAKEQEKEESHSDCILRDEKMGSLLECFPSMSTGSGLHMPKLHCGEGKKLVPVDCDLEPHSSVLATTSNRLRSKPCRPSFWSSLHDATFASSWSEYSKLKKSIVNRKRKNKSQDFEEFSLHVDFDVFHPQVYSHSVDVTPVFRVICIDARDQTFSLSDVHRRISDRSVVFSIFEGGKVNFINVSGGSVDLEELKSA